MTICNKCGAQLKDGVLFCTKCGNLISGPGTNSRNDDDFFGLNSTPAQPVQPDEFLSFGEEVPSNNYGEKAREIGSQLVDVTKKAAGFAASAVKTGVGQVKTANAQNRAANANINQNRKLVMADGEIPIRSYNVSKETFGRTPGKLTVTNKRIIFSAASAKSKAFMSTPIDTVGSIDIITGRNYLMLIYGILLILPIITIPLAISMIRKSKAMYISISATNSSPGMVIGDIATGGKALDAAYGNPGRDVGLIMAELGAMVLDLQQFGDNAIEKWKR